MSMKFMDMTRMMDEFTPMGDKRTFDIEFVKLDVARKTGGELVTLRGVRKMGSVFNQKSKQMINVLAPGAGGHPQPVHLRLITKFNDERIYY